MSCSLGAPGDAANFKIAVAGARGRVAALVQFPPRDRARSGQVTTMRGNPLGGIRFPCQYDAAGLLYDANGNRVSVADLNDLGEKYEALRKAAKAVIDSANTTTVSAAALHILMEQT